MDQDVTWYGARPQPRRLHVSSWATVCKTVRPMLSTYGLFSSECVTLFRSATSTAVVEPLDRKAYWSVKHRVAGGQSSAGYRKSLTMIFSVMRDRTEVTDIGRKSLVVSVLMFLALNKFSPVSTASALQMAGWTKMPLGTWYGGKPRPRRCCTRWGRSST